MFAPAYQRILFSDACFHRVRLLPFVQSFTLLGVFFSLSVAVQAQPETVQPGYCAAPAEMMSTLQADAGGDVHTLAMMNKHEVDVDTNDPNVKTAQVVMSNSDFSKGYIIKGNAPLGQSSSQLCVSATIRDMEVNDFRIDREPTVARYTFNTEAAIEQYETIETNVGGNVACGERSHALSVFEQDENGSQRLAFQGIETRADGEDGVLWTLIADPTEGDFRTLGSLDKGATIVGGRGSNFQITATLEAYFSEQE